MCRQRSFLLYLASHRHKKADLSLPPVLYLLTNEGERAAPRSWGPAGRAACKEEEEGGAIPHRRRSGAHAGPGDGKVRKKRHDGSLVTHRPGVFLQNPAGVCRCSCCNYCRSGYLCAALTGGRTEYRHILEAPGPGGREWPVCLSPEPISVAESRTYPVLSAGWSLAALVSVNTRIAAERASGEGEGACEAMVAMSRRRGSAASFRGREAQGTRTASHVKSEAAAASTAAAAHW